MKGLIIVILLAAAGYFVYQKYAGGPPQTFENPVYGEMRMTASVGNREIEAAVFVRASDDLDCKGRGLLSWRETFEGCPSCKLQEPKCHAVLPPRYARLFDNVPIPSAYLSADAGNAAERDGRVVIYGLTDAEGAQMCELLKAEAAKKYEGKLTCIAPSGG
ncbi:MAG: hypothetical protein H7Y89_11070 [Steroidobacteraceae bacterium]|nr:hypothetical protein [Steroidobacteraceae bacterium]